MSEREHRQRVERLVRDIRERHAGAGPASLSKSSVSHFVPDPYDPRHGDTKLDVRGLDRILDIDVAAQTCTAEPGVTFAQLARETLAHGLAPAMVPELEHITIGGAVAGCAIESMAHREGGFHDSCLAYEIVTGRGEVLSCSRDNNPDVFEMMHGSYGTLGVLTKLVFRLVPAKPFVRIEYQTYRDYPSLHRRMMECTENPQWDFIDAIAHDSDRFVLCLGRFVDEAPCLSDYRAEEIYYLSTKSRPLDYLHSYDYFFRFDTDCHWATSVIPGMRSRLGRRLLGRFFLGSTRLLTWARWLRPLERLRQRPVVTDVFIPVDRAEEFHAWYQRTVAHYPLWIVPYRMREPYPWIKDTHAARSGARMFVDFAVYGAPNDRPRRDLSELIERETARLGGIKTLIGENHYDEATFWQIYDRAAYSAVKARVDPDNLFRDVYDKRVRYQLGSCDSREDRRLTVQGGPTTSRRPSPPSRQRA